jgi:hypothetical protein
VQDTIQIHHHEISSYRHHDIPSMKTS